MEAKMNDSKVLLFYEGMSEGEIDVFEAALEKVLANCIAAEAKNQT